ncbi:HK97 family phage prohead protease [Clostridium sp. YIM B02569]|uniref:HK97 family phage prohead protease n=1 Tax=Clostridium sp. YIM B02569 TaxID=2911967 RepID=UPI001EEAF90B|nr:HK97 family phage prohead protease [Clostridium sp. YIM B02569]
MQVEIRSDHVVVRGYVNACERDSRELPSPKGKFVEQVRSGVWQRALERTSDVPVLLNHDWSRKLGSTKDNLKLKEDNIGLYAEARIYDSDVIEKAKNNKLVGWSFSFIPQKQSWGKTDTDVERRYLEDIILREVSILDNTRTPAYYGTSIEARDNEEVCIEQRFIQDQVEVIPLEEEKREDEINLKLKLMELELQIM